MTIKKNLGLFLCLTAMPFLCYAPNVSTNTRERKQKVKDLHTLITKIADELNRETTPKIFPVIYEILLNDNLILMLLKTLKTNPKNESVNESLKEFLECESMTAFKSAIFMIKTVINKQQYETKLNDYKNDINSDNLFRTHPNNPEISSKYQDLKLYSTDNLKEIMSVKLLNAMEEQFKRYEYCTKKISVEVLNLLLQEQLNLAETG
jgi:hypothetical protein